MSSDDLYDDILIQALQEYEKSLKIIEQPLKNFDENDELFLEAS